MTDIDAYARMSKPETGAQMETMQQPKIIGYRELTEDEAALMNEGKRLAEQCGLYINKLRQNTALDQRWVNIGATDLQTGFMAAIRGIARPTSF